MVTSDAFGAATLRRIEWLTLALGGAGAALASWRLGWRGGVGLALGAALSWINFRWLKGSVQAFGSVATAQAESGGMPGGVPVKVRVSKGAYLKFFGRFALLLGAVYVILTHSWLPAVSVLAGLFASAAAVVVGLIYELLSSGVRQNVNGSL